MGQAVFHLTQLWKKEARRTFPRHSFSPGWVHIRGDVSLWNQGLWGSQPGFECMEFWGRPDRRPDLGELIFLLLHSQKAAKRGGGSCLIFPDCLFNI